MLEDALLDLPALERLPAPAPRRARIARGGSMAEPMNDLSAFDGDAERERQICDLRVKGKSEAEVCQMLGVTVPDIHRALDRAAQAKMNGARPIPE